MTNEELLEQAQALVLGVVTARRNGSEEDVNTLISSYMSEARQAGHSKDMAWAMLFSASTKWVDVLLECSALHHQQPVRTVITDLAMNLANTHG
jgi:hypothetical protein